MQSVSMSIYVLFCFVDFTQNIKESDVCNVVEAELTTTWELLLAIRLFLVFKGNSTQTFIQLITLFK